jgi:hypothetical protein
MLGGEMVQYVEHVHQSGRAVISFPAMMFGNDPQHSTYPTFAARFRAKHDVTFVRPPTASGKNATEYFAGSRTLGLETARFARGCDLHRRCGDGTANDVRNPGEDNVGVGPRKDSGMGWVLQPFLFESTQRANED